LLVLLVLVTKVITQAVAILVIQVYLHNQVVVLKEQIFRQEDLMQWQTLVVVEALLLTHRIHQVLVVAVLLY
jgi:hypothetical protein